MADYKFWLPLTVAIGVGIFASTLQKRVSGLESDLTTERNLRIDLEASLESTRAQLGTAEAEFAQADQMLSMKIDGLSHPDEIADKLLEGERKAELLDALWSEHGGSLAGSRALAAQVAQVIASEYGQELTGNLDAIQAKDIAVLLAESAVFAELVAAAAAE